MTNESKSPLFDSQREKSDHRPTINMHINIIGHFKNYFDHNKINEYAVFVELHE
jgi:hypothetical protein